MTIITIHGLEISGKEFKYLNSLNAKLLLTTTLKAINGVLLMNKKDGIC